MPRRTGGAGRQVDQRNWVEEAELQGTGAAGRGCWGHREVMLGGMWHADAGPQKF